MDKEAQRCLAFCLGIMFIFLGMGGCSYLIDHGSAEVKNATTLNR